VSRGETRWAPARTRFRQTREPTLARTLLQLLALCRPDIWPALLRRFANAFVYPRFVAQLSGTKRDCRRDAEHRMLRHPRAEPHGRNHEHQLRPQKMSQDFTETPAAPARAETVSA